MRKSWIAALLCACALSAAPSDFAGRWRVKFAGPAEDAPRTVGSIVLDLTVDSANKLSGKAIVGVWPGEAPVADAKVEGDHISFTATGTKSSTTGIPTCQFEGTLNGSELVLKMKVIRNPGGPLVRDTVYEYRGERITN